MGSVLKELEVENSGWISGVVGDALLLAAAALAFMAGLTSERAATVALFADLSVVVGFAAVEFACGRVAGADFGNPGPGDATAGRARVVSLRLQTSIALPR